MFIYVGNRYRAAVQGTVIKAVTCEKCGAAYQYESVRTASGGAESPYFMDETGAARRAEDRAVGYLQDLLAKACDPVPCPRCGWLQADMVREVKRRRLRWMLRAAIILPVATLISLVCAAAFMSSKPYALEDNQSTLLLIGAAGLGLGAALALGRWAILRLSDPNGRWMGIPPDGQPIHAAPLPGRYGAAYPGATRP